MPKMTPVLDPVAPRFTVAGALGVKARAGPGPVRLNPGQLIVTIALFVPVSLYRAGAAAPEHETFAPQPVSTPVWLMLMTCPAKVPPLRTRLPKSRFC